MSQIRRALDLQARICSVPPSDLPSSPDTLYYQMANLLTDACDDGRLRGGADDVWRTVRLHSSDPTRFVINLGSKDMPRNQGRSRQSPHFERLDDSWFDFALTAFSDKANLIQLISYTFEIRLDDTQWGARPTGERTPSFIRFDLNPADHDNARLGHRCRVHVGSEDFSMPSPG